MAADYNWTGLGDGHLWSDANNWTNATGAAVAPASTGATAYSYFFPIPAGGLAVTNDITGTVLVNSLAFEKDGGGAATVEIASEQTGCILNFSANSTVDVPADVTLVWKADAAQWNNNSFSKNGEGTLVLDLIRSPSTARTLIVNAGRVEIAPTSAETKYAYRLNGGDVARLPVVGGLRDGETVAALDAQNLGGTVELDGRTLNIGRAGADSSATGQATNALPAIAGGGTLVFQNERAATLSEPASTSFDVVLDRAYLVAPDFDPDICWTFNDTSDPKKDDVGQGARMATSGSPAVVSDATRGNVLSFTGGAYFKGPDENQWLEGFTPETGFTVAFWLKPAANCHNQAKILFWGTNSWGNALAIRLNDASGKNLMVTRWDENQQLPITTLRDGNWHHIAVTFNGKHNSANNFQVYYDGALFHSWIHSGTYAPTHRDLYVGNVAGTAWQNAGSGTPYTGLMDDFALFSRCLSAAEIAKLHGSGAASVVGKPQLGNFTTESSGTLAVKADAVSLATLSGGALAGGVEMAKDGSTLTVGASSASGETGFSGVIGGENTTLVKAGEDYALALSGTAPAVTNVVVEEGTLTLDRSLTKTVPGIVCSSELNLGVNLSDVCATSGSVGTVDDQERGEVLSFSNGAYFYGKEADKGLKDFTPTTGFTVAFWIKPDANCDAAGKILYWGSATDEGGSATALRLDNSSGLMFTYWGNNQTISGLNLNNGAWHHVMVTCNDKTFKVYCDGQVKNTVTASSYTAPNKNFNLGAANNAKWGNNPYTGLMDDFVLFDRGFSDEELQALYAGTFKYETGDAALPDPVAHWTFDSDDPLAEASGNESLKLTATSGTVTYESGDAICGKAARFSATSGLLALDTFPTGVIPTGNASFSVVARYRPDNTYPDGDYSYHVVGWGPSTGYSNGTLFRMAVANSRNASVRAVFRNNVIEVSGTTRVSNNPGLNRWYTVAVTYSAQSIRVFVDGELKKTDRIWNDMNISAQDFTIGANKENDRPFYGLVDDVQIYDRVLSDNEIRMVAEQLEASKGTDGTAGALSKGVLTARPDVTVASGATLKVKSEEALGVLSGAGTVEITPIGTLSLSGLAGFTGTVTGEGTLGIADGAVIDFGDGSTPVFDIDRPLALGANVTVNCTSKSGRMLLARATSFEGVENLETWTASLPGGKPAKFKVASNGTELYLSASSGFVLILR